MVAWLARSGLINKAAGRFSYRHVADSLREACVRLGSGQFVEPGKPPSSGLCGLLATAAASRPDATAILDSLATLQLVSFLEECFAIKIEAHEASVENLNTIEQIAGLVSSKL